MGREGLAPRPSALDLMLRSATHQIHPALNLEETLIAPERAPRVSRLPELEALARHAPSRDLVNGRKDGVGTTAR